MGILALLSIAVIGSVILMKDGKQGRIEKKEAFREYIANHPYTKRDHMTPEELKTIPKADRPDLAQEQNFLMTVDPALGYVPSERLKEAYKRAEETRNMRGAVANVSWNERGPNNIGGRTRALMFDPNDVANGYKKVWAGGVSGGLWYNSDITDASSEWTKVSDTWDNLAITTIAYDPSNTQIFYVGTGEGFYNADAVRGGGIWKTTDGGTTWSLLASTEPGPLSNLSDFDYIQKIVVASNGDVFAATRTYYSNINKGGIMKSTDGGASWVVSKSVSGSGGKDRGADIEISANGDLYASLGLFSTGYMFKSTDNGSNWTDITPAACQRIEIACAPSNNNIVYAVASNREPDYSNIIKWFKKSTDGGTTWSDLTIPKYYEQNCNPGASDFARGQAWYDLIMGVHPTDANLVVLGGIDLYRSTDGGANFGLVSYWTGNCPAYDYVHADQHAIVFHPTNYNIVVTGSDGGVSYSADLGDSGTGDPTFNDRNAGYNVTQFYSCAIHPTAATDYYLGGTQDNGTFKLTSAGVGAGTAVSGGDGAFCFIDQTDPTYQLSSYVYNNWYLSTNSGSSFSGLSGGANTGRFINPADYDNDADILYSAAGNDQLYRISGISASPSATTKTVGGSALGGSQASAIIASPYNDHVLFVGTGAGDIYKVSSANGSPTSVDIDPGINLPGGYISSIDIGADENNLMVTYTTYGVNHVYITTDGGTNWSNKNGDLPDMPVRWAMFNPLNRSEVFLATEVGVWSTTDITAASPEWGATNGGLANVRTDMLQYRSTDRTWLAATHGRGLFTYPEATVEITFQVDMQNQTVSGDGVHLAGNFGNDGYPNWDPAGIAMSDGNSDDVYTVTLTLTANTDYEFKYINGDGWGEDESVPAACGVDNGSGGYNRSLSTTTNDATLDEVCFGECSDCSGGSTLTWNNLQWPENASIAHHENVDIFAQAYEDGVTTVDGNEGDIACWIGYNNADTDPSTWTNWVVATFNGRNNGGLGNNYEYTAALGNIQSLAAGTYYYASRFSLEGGDYTYGGYNGGTWDGTNNVSGVLTVSGPPATATWSGASNNDWATAGNWDNGVPGSTTNVTIPHTGITNFPTVNEARECNDITLAEGATIMGFANLTVNGTATITQNLSGGTSGGKDDADAIYHYISSPMAAATAGSVFPLTAYVRAYDETTQTWVNKTQTDVLAPGTGYSLWLEVGNAAVSYEGQFNTADIPVNGLTLSGAVIDYSGYHFIGNPFPAALNWDAGTWSPSNLDGSIYIYDGTAGNYKSWNGAAGSLGDGIIGVGQGFFVKANNAGASLTIPVDATLHNSKAVYKNEVENLLNIAVLNTQNNTNDETVIHFRSDASASFDNQMDAYKIYGSQIAPQLYTFAGESHISINTRPFTEEMALNFETGRSGSFVLEIPAFSMNYEVTLEDKLTGKTIELSDQASYSFTASDNDVAERFILRFKDATSVEDVFAGQMQVYSRDQEIILDNATGASAEAVLFTVHGQKLGTFTIENGINKITAPKAAAVYLIQINSGSKTSTQKMFIK